MQGTRIAHVAPPANNVPSLMSDLFIYLKNKDELTLINNTQNKYYEALGHSDKAGNSTLFIEYMLDVIDTSLGELLNYNQRILNDTDRLEYFCSIGKKEFTRKDYMNVFKDISSATASRDFKKGAELKLFIKTGDRNMTIYRLTE